MSTKRRNIFMANIYSSSLVKHHKHSFSSKQKPNDTMLRAEIAKDFSTHCTKKLLIVIRQMNKDITHYVITDLATKGLK